MKEYRHSYEFEYLIPDIVEKEDILPSIREVACDFIDNFSNVYREYHDDEFFIRSEARVARAYAGSGQEFYCLSVFITSHLNITAFDDVLLKYSRKKDGDEFSETVIRNTINFIEEITNEDQPFDNTQDREEARNPEGIRDDYYEEDE